MQFYQVYDQLDLWPKQTQVFIILFDGLRGFVSS